MDLVVNHATQSSPSVSDSDNPRSIINLVPGAVREAIDSLGSDLLGMTEKELEALTPHGSWTVTDRRLRTAFWIEYGRAQDLGQHMNIGNVFNGVCSKPYFYSSVLKNKPRLAYLLLAPQDYRVAMEEALGFGVDRLREILEMPIFDENSKPNPKVADVILKAVQMLDQRVKGAVVQKNLNVNVGSDGKSPNDAKDAQPQTMEEIERRLAELEGPVEAAKKRIPKEIEVTATHITEEEE